MLDGAAEAEPCGQRNAARGLGRQVAEIENDEAEASAFEQEIGGAKNLLETVLGLARGILSRSFFQFFFSDTWSKLNLACEESPILAQRRG